ncbi:hypothetical protein GCM10023142_25550 [Anaerocolumna aminovalerica]|jgi:hypothetical protein|uniref:Oxaloacetate decarboxylase, gamma chain n=1 Tax=Anaerocolumna aminovalerica TaxID=1527 RepID=A0A1I5H1J4_9FIRM|nr:hypothetical protein [Anaerocolumna aminovalerica]MDU6265905.1 hypothetical protein [Anaerocolumna aminovalerica]SFO41990.1 hypothetical protein SAMN04489757_12468 [Anaerocolumna aminovalerica]
MLENFKTSLQIMGMGMLGIFTVIIVITLFVIVLEKVDKKLEKK